jgi:hypothetical protein
MATVINTSIVSLAGVTYNIYLDNGAPSDAGVDLSIRDASIAYKDDITEIDARIITGKQTVTFTVNTLAEAAIFKGMVEAVELQYRLRIHKGADLWWVGFVILDFVTEDFGGFPKDFKVVATDGIARLKTIDYDHGDLAEQVTIKDYLFRIFAQIPLTDYYATSAEYLRIHTNLWPEGLTPTTAISQIDRLRLSVKALRTVDDRGSLSFRTYYEVLIEILTLLGCRLVYSQGRYVIAELTSYAQATDTNASATANDINFHRYDIGGTLLAPINAISWLVYSNQIGNLQDDDAVVLAGGKITYLPPLQGVDLIYRHFTRQNITPGLIGEPVGLSAPFAEINNFGTDGGAGRIMVSGTISGTIVDADGDPVEMPNAFYLFAIQLVIVDEDDVTEGVSLSRSYTVSSAGVTHSAITWNTNNPDQLAYFHVLTDNNPAVEASFSFTTPIVPRAGRLRFRVTAIGLFRFNNSGQQTIVDRNVVASITGLSMESLLSGSIEDQYVETLFEPRTDGGGANSVLLERTMLFGDGPGDNTFGRIEYSPNGTAWERTTGWRRWAGGAYLNTVPAELGALRSQAILNLQKTTRQRLDISLIAPDYNPEFLFGCGDDLFMMQAATLDLARDEWRGRWVEVAGNFVFYVDDGTPITVSGSGVGFDPPPPAPPPPPTPPTQPDGPGGVLVGLSNVIDVLGGLVTGGATVTSLQIDTSENPLFAGDTVRVVNNETGQTQDFVILYDSGFIPGLESDDGAVPYYVENEVVWLIPSTTTVAVASQTAAFDLPVGSFIYPTAASISQIRELFRVNYKDAEIHGFSDSFTVGLSDWFWRPERRQGWHIRRVHFAFAVNPGGTAKVNLKYYDATGFRYTVATHDGGGLGSVQAASVDIMPGYFRAEVETVSTNDIKGLTIHIEMIKRINQ